MAKITETIAGYENMTAEEKLAALEALDQPEAKPDPEAAKLKTQLSKANSEAADLKRQLQAKMTEEEKKRALEEENSRKLQERIKELERKDVVNTYTASYLALGYDEALAKATAEAMADGDMTKVFANQKAFLETHDKAVLTGAVKNTPTPPAGSGNSATPMTKDEIFKIKDTLERQKAIAENIELFQ